jgi:hypothetical protein
MGLKLEIFLSVMIIMVLSLGYAVKITNNTSLKKLSTKELEFTQTTFREVDTNKTDSVASSSYGIRDAGILTLYDLRYHTDKLELLFAKRGIYKGHKIYLDDNVSVNQKEGFSYYTEHAVYDKKMQIVDIPSAFTAVMNKNSIRGSSLLYDVRNKEALGKHIDAVVYTIEK